MLTSGPLKEPLKKLSLYGFHCPAVLGSATAGERVEDEDGMEVRQWEEQRRSKR